MKTKKSILVAVMQVFAVFILSTQAMAVLHTTTYNDGLTTGLWNGPQSATITQAATVFATAVAECATCDEWCWEVQIKNPFTFSYADTITLPQVGATFSTPNPEPPPAIIGPALADQAFHDGGKIHEDWHKDYIGALLGSTYGALETWSASYKNRLFHTQAAALAAGNTDLANALAVAQNAFQADFSTDVTNDALGHQNTRAIVQNINGVDTWVGVNDDWGQAAVNYANAITVNFTKTPGDAECVPEPVTMLLLALGGVLLRKRS